MNDIEPITLIIILFILYAITFLFFSLSNQYTPFTHSIYESIYKNTTFPTLFSLPIELYIFVVY